MKFLIRNKPGKVIAERRDKAVVGSISEIKVIAKELPQLITASEIVGAVIMHKDIPKFYFPHLKDIRELRKVYNWTFLNGWFMVFDEETGLVLTKDDPGELKYVPA